jgi:hypothetical protein
MAARKRCFFSSDFVIDRIDNTPFIAGSLSCGMQIPHFGADLSGTNPHGLSSNGRAK